MNELKHKTIFRPKSIITKHVKVGSKHIALVAGGMSAEREVSLMSAQGVLKTLIKLGYQVTFVDMGADISRALNEIKPDIVFNCLHGTYGEDGCLPGLLNIMRIPYTHSGVLASSLALCKIKSKELFAYHDIPIIKSVIVNKSDKLKSDPMPRPYVIKPGNQGSSIGIELVFEKDYFNFQNYDFPYGDKIIIEQYIAGPEMQVAVLNGKPIGVLEIELLKRRFYDYNTKYTEGMANHIYPARVTQNVYNQLMNTAKKAYNILGCKGLARVEFIYNNKENKIFILEVNTHPGITSLSICPEIASYNGIDFEQFIEEILATANFENE